MQNSTKQMKTTRFSGNGVKAFIAKLSRGLMIPIAVLPIAGLFLGVGAGFENIIKQAMKEATEAEINQAMFFFTMMKNIGDVIFANLPILFALGVAVAFTEDAGVAVFSTFVGWLIFNGTQSTFIQPVLNSAGDKTESYKILFFLNVPTSAVTTNLGIRSLQTSVFGGILVGLIVAGLYNKFHKFQPPKVLGFFGGVRFVPIMAFLTLPLLAFFFLLTWPVIGKLLEQFGKSLASMPAGLDSLIFGVTERSLIPFGLHHAFYTPLWYSSVGGSLLETTIGVANPMEAFGNQNIWFAFISEGIPFNLLQLYDPTSLSGFGDWTIGASSTDGLMEIANTATKQTFTLTEHMNPGSYMQGKFPFMMFGLPAAGGAMIMACHKEKRQVAMSVIGAAAFTAFLTGITEPLEYTFLFLAPILYYGFHIWMAGLSFFMLDNLNSHLGMTFSGGIFDFVLYGIIPDATGAGAQSWWVLVVGIMFVPIYYLVFYSYIIKFDVKTPGRTDDDKVVMLSKASFQSAKVGFESEKTKPTSQTGPIKSKIETKIKDKPIEKTDREKRVLLLAKHLGGINNLEEIDACITRLRVSVTDRSLVNDEGLMKLGAVGIVGTKGKSIQVIFGAEADIFKTELKELRKK